MLVALRVHDGTQVARHELQAHPLELLRMVLLSQRQRCRHRVHLRGMCRLDVNHRAHLPRARSSAVALTPSNRRPRVKVVLVLVRAAAGRQQPPGPVLEQQL